jgi:hypothetical protein
MQTQPRRIYPGILFIFILAGLACTVPGFNRQPEWPDPSPETDTISFTIPSYNATLQPGNDVPGTFMRYLDRTGETYEVSIDGVRALKRAGDSFIWDGIMAQAVFAQYNLRLGSTTMPAGLPVEGSVTVHVFNPTPQSIFQLPAETTTAVHYQNIPIDYIVSPGQRIPGTDLTLSGFSQAQGIILAQLSGPTGSQYPLLAQNDSFSWTGTVRPNVVLQYSLRTIAVNEQGIRLSGTAEMWVWRLPIPGR